jgi:hypothetical protein
LILRVVPANQLIDSSQPAASGAVRGWIVIQL